MLDTRDYAIIDATDNFQMILKQNTELKKYTNTLTASLILITISVVVGLYWNHLEDKKRGLQIN